MGGLFILGFMLGIVATNVFLAAQKHDVKITIPQEYWFSLHRKSNIELLYKGVPGQEHNSVLLKTFKVKTGIPGERPTPLPQLLGRKYWVLTEKYQVEDNPEVGKYFIELNIPLGVDYPYGPTPYLECGGEQCDWILPGAFGLHGVNGDISRLSTTDSGSSGCVRHTDEDIAYLYKLLDTSMGQRYYIQDN